MTSKEPARAGVIEEKIRKVLRLADGIMEVSSLQPRNNASLLKT